MDDLISRQEAIDALNEQIKYCDKAIGSFDISMKDEYAVKVERASLMAYAEKLEALLSAQPEIIYCRDCKHWREGTAFSYCVKLYSMGVRTLYDYMKTEDEYCSMAERRNDETD